MADDLITKKITEVQNFSNGDLGTIIQVQGDEIGQTSVGTLKQDITNSVVTELTESGGVSLNLINLKGVVPTYADLPTVDVELNDAYQVEADGLVYVYTENGFQAEGEGFKVQPDVNGVVEEGNTEAVSGNEVYKTTNELNIDRLNPLPINEYHTPLSARNSVPISFRKKGVTITYGQIYGAVKETFVGTSGWSTANLLWDSDSSSNIIGILNSFNSEGVNLIFEHPNFVSNFIELKEDLTVKNLYSYGTSKVYASVYDIAFNYIGYLTDDSIVGGITESKDIIFNDVKLLFPNVAFVVINGQLNKSLKVFKKSNFVSPKIVSWDLSYQVRNRISSGSLMLSTENAVFNQVEKYAGEINIDRLVPSGAIYTKQIARGHTPLSMRVKGTEITYKQDYGYISERFVGSTWTTGNQSWDEQTNRYYIENDNSIKLLNDTLLDWSDGVFVSKFLKVTVDFTLLNFYVLSGDNRVLFAYDLNGNFLGNYTSTGLLSGLNNRFDVSISALKALYPNVVYVKALGQANKGFRAFSTTNYTTLSALNTYELNLKNTNYFTKLEFYTNKVNGQISSSAAYKTTPFLKITNINQIYVTGYSGISNNASLLVCFNSDLKYIGFYNAGVNGQVVNHKVDPSLLPIGTMYVCANANIGQSGLITGVELPTQQSFTENFIKLVNESSGSVQRRSVMPNPSSGGYIKFNNYLGNAQNIHPKVLYFDSGWNGFKYWMAYTPYPFGATDAENPCIAVSNDGESWSTPTGLTNPLATAPSGGYNSDTHFVFRNDLNRLELWYRPYHIADNENQICRRVSTDGLTWGAVEILIDYTSQSILSPSVIFEDNKYKMWYCDAGVVKYQESTDGLTWSSPTIIPMAYSSTFRAWHMDVIKTELGLEFLIQGYKDGGGNNTGDLYYVLYNGSTYSEPVIVVYKGDEPSRLDYRGLYRGSILKMPDGVYKIYYSGIATDWARFMYLTQGRDIKNLRGVNL